MFLRLVCLMKVVLIAHTPHAEKLVASAARLCYSKIGIGEIMEKISSDKVRQRIRDCIKHGHHSVLEHACFTFGIEGISRVATHQLVRHRIASFSQQSQRYVNLKGITSFVIPAAIKKNKAVLKSYLKLLKKCKDYYRYLQEEGISCEDARFIIPQSVETKILVTMNARELLHFFNLRCCQHAQWEIRSVAYKMLSLAKKVAPVIFEGAGPKCFMGTCPEEDWKCFKKIKGGRL